jgi:hypothetical protein
MFDSLYIDLEGTEREVQTKRFDCSLSAYRLGDCIASARRLRAGGELKGVLGLVREEDQRLIRGDDPLDVVEWALGCDTLGWGFRSGAGATADPLEDYRL